MIVRPVPSRYLTSASRFALALAASSVLATGAMAQDTEADDIGEIVVVGVMTDVELTRDEIVLTQASDLADLFRRTPSVAVGGSVGIAQKIYVRGLEDSMLNVTVDGAPQHGTLFHHVGRVSIEPELLKSVDVRAGAGEATSGFGAIGGSIRFRTVDATDLLEPGRNFGGIAKAGWFSNNGQKYSLTGYGRIAGDVGVVASYVTVDRDAMEDGDGNEILGTAAKQKFGFVKVGGDLGGGHRLSVSYEVRDEEGAFGQRPNWPVVVGQPLFAIEGKRGTGVINYGYDVSDTLGLEITGYHTKSEVTQNRTDRWGLFGAEIETYGFDARGRWNAGAHDVTFGIEHRNDQVVAQYLGAPAQWQPEAWDPAIGRFEEKGSLLGAYVQDHWQVSEPLLVSFGARYDAYDLDLLTYGEATDSDGVSFNAGATYKLSENLKLNVGYAEAFRGKEIGDAFAMEQRPGRITLQPGLRPEKVDNIEGGLSWARDGFSASAVYYTMTIDDVILDQLYTGAAPQGVVYYENVGQFKSDGVELRAGYRTGPFTIDAFYNTYESKLNGNRIEGYENIGLGNSLGDTWNLTASYAPSERFGLTASVTKVEALNDIEVLFREVELYGGTTEFVDKPGYTVVDLFARWQPLENSNFELLGGVYNLFDEQYRSHASVADYRAIPGFGLVAGVYEPGRNVRVSASLKF